MRISNIKIKNFKNFEDLSIDFDDINVIIGSCSSGKSNLFEVFQFLKDISEDFKKAIIKHGGPYIQNINSQDEPTYLKITFDNKYFGTLSFGLGGYVLDIPEDTNVTLNFKEINYEVSFNLNEFDYQILNEAMELKFDVYEFKENIQESDFIPKFSDNKLVIRNENGDFNAFLKNEELFLVNGLIPNSLLNMARNNFIHNNIPLINSPLASVPVPWFLLFGDLKFYDFIPKLSKKSFSEKNGENNLLSYGENLSNSLYNILNDEYNQRKFINLLKDLLPDIEAVNVDIIQDMHVFSIIERFSDYNLPSPLVSDGTSNIIALITALYFEDSKSIFIEEPERNIHPALFLKIVQMFKEASLNKQIFISTHSPEILKNVDLEDIYFISKNDEGYSNISKPIENEVLKTLIIDLGIDEIFVDNYLDIK